MIEVVCLRLNYRSYKKEQKQKDNWEWKEFQRKGLECSETIKTAYRVNIQFKYLLGYSCNEVRIRCKVELSMILKCFKW